VTRKRRGSLECRAGRWFLRVTTERVDDASGEIHRIRQRIELGSSAEIRSEASARRLADAWLARHRPHELRAGTSTTFAQVAERFLRLVVRGMGESSQASYTGTIRNHLIPHLAAIEVNRLTAEQLQELMIRLSRSGLKRGTVGKVRSVAKQVLRHAAAARIDVAEIDWRLVRAPRDEGPPREVRYIKPSELQAILAAAEKETRPLLAIMGYLGLRVSEVLALHWRDIDLAAGELTVRQSLGRGGLKATKTRTSAATLPLPPPLLDILAAFQGAQARDPSALLFTSTRGTPRNSDNLRSRQWARLLKRLGIEHCGFHSLRHGVPGRLYALGMRPDLIQRVMRHSKLAMTERYSHFSKDELRDAVTRAYRNSQQP
jgi:integrase